MDRDEGIAWYWDIWSEMGNGISLYILKDYLRGFRWGTQRAHNRKRYSNILVLDQCRRMNAETLKFQPYSFNDNPSLHTSYHGSILIIETGRIPGMRRYLSCGTNVRATRYHFEDQ